MRNAWIPLSQAEALLGVKLDGRRRYAKRGCRIFAHFRDSDPCPSCAGPQPRGRFVPGPGCHACKRSGVVWASYWLALRSDGTIDDRL